MPRKSESKTEKPAKIAANTLEGRAAPFLERIERLAEEGESAKGTYMAECKERREDIKQIYIEAKDAGIATRALRAVVKGRGLQKKIDALDAGLDIDEASQFRHLAEALGGSFGAYARTRADAADLDKEADAPTKSGAQSTLAGAMEQAINDDKRDMRPRHMTQLGAETPTATEEPPPVKH